MTTTIRRLRIHEADYAGTMFDSWPPIPAKFLKAYEHAVARIAGGAYTPKQKADGHRWVHYLLSEMPAPPPKGRKK